MQTKTQSIIESVANILIGYAVAMASQLAIFPMFNIHISLSDNIAISAWFTAISLLRSYGVRRLFNRWHHGI